MNSLDDLIAFFEHMISDAENNISLRKEITVPIERCFTLALKKTLELKANMEKNK